MNSTALKTAYILLVHKNPDQVNKFIEQILLDENSDIFIHVDQKNNMMSAKITKHPRVKILKVSIDVKWGDISMVDATLLLLKEVLATGVEYDFVCLRSGQDMLVKNGFKDFLFKNKNKIFISAYHVVRNEPHAAFVNLKWPEWTRRLYIQPYHPIRLIRRGMASLYGFGLNIQPNKNSLPKEFSLYNGSNWFCIPLKVACFIVNFLVENNWYYEAFKNSLVPDVFFFQTLIMNSEFKTEVVNRNLMFIQFGESIKTRNNPITLKMDHIEIIKNSNEYFARKFDQGVDYQVIEYFAKLAKI
ncbi:beta-1,6-N-acetylglucosaminyltransferase [Bacillus sp. MM2020_1]|nr:beta-1,6-N-acetylglucosaminyltransferase [Bacillus sp. MM2020_1]